MKSIPVFIPLMFICNSIFAQTEQRSTFVQDLHERLKEKVKLTDAQSDTVLRYEMIFLKRSGKLKRNTDLPEDSVKLVIDSYKLQRNNQIDSALHLQPAKFKKLLTIIPDSAPKPKIR